MVYRPNIDPSLCFVLMPFKPPFTENYNLIIRPAVEDAGLKALKADEIYGIKPVIRDIWNHIWRARIVVADVTTKNPNVNYELGMCHSLGVPTILIAKTIEDVPFDYHHRRCILYDVEKPLWGETLRKTIAATIQSVLAETEEELEELRWPYDTHAMRSRGKAVSLWSSEDALDIVIRGTKLVETAVVEAFGPLGSLVSVASQTGSPRQVKDGRAIANAIRSTDPLEMRGVKQMQALMQEAHNIAGDLTKTAAILCYGMLHSGRESQRSGSSAANIVAGIKAATDQAVLELRNAADRSQDTESLKAVARTAASGDEMVAGMVVESLAKVGKDGVIYVQDSNEGETYLEFQEGMHLDQGYLDEGFVNQPERQECFLSDCSILIYDRRISSIRSLLGVLEQVINAKRSLLIIAEDVEGEALATLLINKHRGVLSCVAVKAPGYGDRRKAMLEDIAVLTGGAAIMSGLGMTLDNVSIAHLGSAKKVIATKDDTTIFGGAGTPADIERRVKQLRASIDRTSSVIDREKLQERLSKLAGGAVAIRVGAPTEVEAHARRYQIESAMHSVRSALDGGTVVGGGAALDAVSEILSKRRKDIGDAAGVQAVLTALKDPRKCLLDKAPVLQADSPITSNLLDPANSLARAIEIASSHARAILQTGAWDLAEASDPTLGRM